MNRKTVSGMMGTLLLIGTLLLVFNIQPVRAIGTIYIRPDGFIDPSTAPIYRDEDLYTLTNNITSDADGIVIERDNMTLDGAGYTLSGTGITWSIGINLSERSNVTIKNTNVRSFYFGINIKSSSFNSVSGNNITANNWNGLQIWASSNNTVSGNNITNNDLGIFLYDSSNNTISGNNIANDWYGIWLSYSSSNSIFANTFVNDGLFVQYSYWNVIDDNLVNGKPLVYLEGASHYVIVADAGQVILVSCDHIKVENLNLSSTDVGVELWETNNTEIVGNNIINNGYGIYVDRSSNNTISGNNIANNDFGIYVGLSSNNTISGNNIANDWYGIYLNVSSNNTISGNLIVDNEEGIVHSAWCSGNLVYHNNFIDNAEQVHGEEAGGANVWDDGYPSGGNYWSDYAERYPDATEIDDSGIWDTPYYIDDYNQDNYPLMEPRALLPATIDELKAEIEELGSEGEIDNLGIVNSLIAKLNVAQKLVDKGKIDETKSILEEDFIPQVQNLSGIHITVEAADILIESAEYILSHL